MDHVETSRRTFLITGVGLVAGLVVCDGLQGGPAHAALPWPIVGEVGGSGQFEILSYSWGIAGTGRRAGPVQKNGEVTFVKPIDGASGALAAAVANGDRIATASISVEGKGGNALTYVMSDVLITAYVLNSTTETVTLDYASLKTSHK